MQRENDSFPLKILFDLHGKLDFSKDKGKINKFSGWLRIVSDLTPFVHIVVVASKKKKGIISRFKSVSYFPAYTKSFGKMFYQKLKKKKHFNPQHCLKLQKIFSNKSVKCNAFLAKIFLNNLDES